MRLACRRRASAAILVHDKTLQKINLPETILKTYSSNFGRTKVEQTTRRNRSRQRRSALGSSGLLSSALGPQVSALEPAILKRFNSQQCVGNGLRKYEYSEKSGWRKREVRAASGELFRRAPLGMQLGEKHILFQRTAVPD